MTTRKIPSLKIMLLMYCLLVRVLSISRPIDFDDDNDDDDEDDAADGVERHFSRQQAFSLR